VGLAAIAPLFGELPAPWHRAVPVCEAERAGVVVAAGEVAAVLASGGLDTPDEPMPAPIEVVWDRSQESPAAASLRRLTRARRGAAW
jgi:hypothetical protein